MRLPSRARRPKKVPRDVNELAARIVRVTAGQASPLEMLPVPDNGNPAAVALGKLGTAKGGKARAEKLSKKQRHSRVARGRRPEGATRQAVGLVSVPYREQLASRR